jgi:asparagine synthase (glutamine-hydrolysing)
MCGIAGIIDLTATRPVPAGILKKMADALLHRGPDEEGFLERPGLGFASRRLSIVGLADGQQPIFNEDRGIAVVFNGELFDYPEQKAVLEKRGHRFATHCDTELIPHFWEDHREGLFEQLHGQFAFALWDERRRQVLLGRDRFGICPLFWTRQTRLGSDWLVFASEIKAMLASGLIDPRPDVRGIDNVFHFFAIPGPTSCFEGVQALLPGHYLSIQLGRSGEAACVSDHVYWQIDFPDRGQEEIGDESKLVDEFQTILEAAVERRLRADVPVVSYLSGGIDSSTVVALATHTRGRPIPTFTIRIMDPTLDETSQAAVVSRHIGAEPVVVAVGHQEVLDNYQDLLVAGEGPVVDTSCTALMLLAEEVHRRGYKVALTGEGSDEWLAGYSWFKVNQVLRWFDLVPGVPGSHLLRRLYSRRMGLRPPRWSYMNRLIGASGGYDAFHEVYGLMALSRLRFYSESMKEALADHIPYEALTPDLERLRRIHPLNRGLYWGGRIHLVGNLLSLKGDRVAMHSAVETRYPFLDEQVFAFLAKLHPGWKLRGFREKFILRKLGERWLPRSIAWGPKGMFRAPFDSFFINNAPAYVEQLLSEEALERTGYFDVQAVRHWKENFRNIRPGLHYRTSVEMGLVAVVATQLWHHTFIDSTLADLPDWKTVHTRNLERLMQTTESQTPE